MLCEAETQLHDSEANMQRSTERIETLQSCQIRDCKHIQTLKQTANNLRDEEDNIIERIWNTRIELQMTRTIQRGVNGRTQGA